MKRIFVSDCEGPVAKNDIAYELAAYFLPEGDRIFDTIQKYDYVHAAFPRRLDYKLGSASKLVLPFLLAFDADNATVEEFCASNLVLLKGSEVTLNYVAQLGDAFLVSTSYEHYVRALCRAAGFPLENTYSTEVNLDDFQLNSKEKGKLKSLAWEIGGMPPINIPSNATSLKNFSSKDQATINRLDKIFWKEVAGTHCKRIFSDVKIASEAEKANAVAEVAGNLSSSLENMMYVGDDWADVEAMKLVKEGGGLTVAINGDAAAVRNAQLAILSDNSEVISVLADLFLRYGMTNVTTAAGSFDRDALWRSSANPALLDRLFALPPSSWPKVYFVSQWNAESIADESELFRKRVVGEPIVNKS